MHALSALRRLGGPMSILLAGILLFHAGWYLLLPFFAVLFTSRRGLTPAEAGLLLATQSFTLLAGSLLGGWLADRFGRRVTMLLGLVGRAGGLYSLGLATSMPSLLASVTAAGLGGGFYGPAAKAGIAALATAENRTTAFAARGIAANIGVSIGPVIGALLIRGPMGLLFGVAAALHLGLAGITWALYREERPAVHAAAGPWWAVAADRPYMGFTLVTVLAWALFAQLAIAVPLYARAVLGLESAIGLLWTATSLTVILLQFSVTRLSTRHLRPMQAMAMGALLLGAGLGLVSLARGFGGLLLAVLLFIAGEMLLMPTADSAVSAFAGEKSLGSYFGVATVAWGLGEGLGNLVGGNLMQHALVSGRLWLPWSLYALAGLLVAALYLLVGRAMRPAASTPAEQAQIQLFRPGQPARSERPLPGILLKGTDQQEEK